uniref:hypothetical protein n=1 Tax=Candidatus Electronema sp. TaxID=2698783 RepID=UPI004057B071
MDERNPRSTALAKAAEREIAEKKIKFKRQLLRRSLHGGNPPASAIIAEKARLFFKKRRRPDAALR